MKGMKRERKKKEGKYKEREEGKKQTRKKIKWKDWNK